MILFHFLVVLSYHQDPFLLPNNYSVTKCDNLIWSNIGASILMKACWKVVGLITLQACQYVLTIGIHPSTLENAALKINRPALQRCVYRREDSVNLPNLQARENLWTYRTICCRLHSITNYVKVLNSYNINSITENRSKNFCVLDQAVFHSWYNKFIKTAHSIPPRNTHPSSLWDPQLVFREGGLWDLPRTSMLPFVVLIVVEC